MAMCLDHSGHTVRTCVCADGDARIAADKQDQGTVGKQEGWPGKEHRPQRREISEDICQLAAVGSKSQTSILSSYISLTPEEHICPGLVCQRFFLTHTVSIVFSIKINTERFLQSLNFLKICLHLSGLDTHLKWHVYGPSCVLSLVEELKAPLEEYVHKRYPGLVKVVRNQKREGLIRARIEGWKAATGQVTGFFDAHVEFTAGW